MLVEEFKRCINSGVKPFFDEKEVETLEKAARLADDYTLTHKVSYANKAILEIHFTHLPVLTSVLVSNLVISLRLLPKPNLLVKTKFTTLYLSLFVIIGNNQVVLFLTVLF